MEFNPAPRKPRNPDLPPPPPSRFDLFLESEGIALSSPRPPFVRSHLALLGLEYAWLSSRAKFDIFNEAIYRGFWERHEDISDMAVLMDYATRAGLNPKAFRDSLTSEQYAAHVVPFDDDVYAIGVRHVPSFIFNGEELLAEAPYSSLAGAAERFLIRSEKFKEKIAQK
jgi:predicted DsbA family dithiol-disulfide isomerase